MYVFFHEATQHRIKVGNRRVWNTRIAPTRMLIRVPKESGRLLLIRVS